MAVGQSCCPLQTIPAQANNQAPAPLSRWLSNRIQLLDGYEKVMRTENYIDLPRHVEEEVVVKSFGHSPEAEVVSLANWRR